MYANQQSDQDEGYAKKAWAYLLRDHSKHEIDRKRSLDDVACARRRGVRQSVEAATRHGNKAS